MTKKCNERKRLEGCARGTDLAHYTPSQSKAGIKLSEEVSPS